MATKHERFGVDRQPGWNKKGSSGYAAYRGNSRAWCYLCNAEHSKAEHDAIREVKRASRAD